MFMTPVQGAGAAMVSFDCTSWKSWPRIPQITRKKVSGGRVWFGAISLSTDRQWAKKSV